MARAGARVCARVLYLYSTRLHDFNAAFGSRCYVVSHHSFHTRVISLHGKLSAGEFFALLFEASLVFVREDQLSVLEGEPVECTVSERLDAARQTTVVVQVELIQPRVAP